ncbi:MAG: PPC domain-containing DNA-binding protein [Thermodesulfobacteriota bacterium]
MLKIANPQDMEPRFLEKVDLAEVLFFRLQPGEDLFKRITEVCKENKIERAVILSAIGSLCDVAFRDLKTGIELPVNVDKTNLMKEYGPFELLTLEGNVFPLVGEFGALKHGDLVIHLHATLGTAYGNVFGGHIFEATIFTTTEIFLAKVKNSDVKKKQSAVTGLTEMRADL